MSKLASHISLPENNPVRFSSVHTEISSDRKTLRRRRGIRSPSFAVSNGGRGRRSIPATPLLQWKFDEGPHGVEKKPAPGGETFRRPRKVAGESRPAVSARRLAAGIWNYQIPKGVGGAETSLDLETGYGHLHLPSYVSNGNCINFNHSTYEEFISLLAIRSQRNGVSLKPEASVSLPPSCMERATKWYPGFSKLSKDAYDLHNNLKLLEKQKTNGFSIVSALRSELELARSKVSELEYERRSAMKNLDCFIRKTEEKKVAWRRREHEKIRSVIDAMKDDLNREAKSAWRLEILNSKLVKDLKETKLSAKQFLKKYEKERKARELMHEVCNELANEIGDDKANVEALKMESVKTREEVEEERKMMQMAEVWREERVHMKLNDAKLTLEEKYSQLSKLQGEIEAFLRSKNGNRYDVSEIKQAEALKEAVGSLKGHDMVEFSYQTPPISDGIYSIFKELQPKKNVKEVEQWYESVAPKTNGLSEKPMKRYDNLMFDGNCDAEDDSEWETASHVEEQDSCKSPDSSEPSVNGIYFMGHASASGTDYGDDEKQHSEISEVCSTTTKKSRKKGSSLSRLWKSSRRSNTEDFKKISLELNHERLCSSMSFDACQSPARKSAETDLRSSSVGNWNSPNLLKQNITQGMKGSVDWPHAMNKQSLKAKLMEGRIQSQEVQLRHILEQTI